MRKRDAAGAIHHARDVPSLDGHVWEDRFVIVVRDYDLDDDDENASLLAVGITSRFDRPVRLPCIELPYGPGKGLNRASVAHCEWIMDLRYAKLDTGGRWFFRGRGLGSLLAEVDRQIAGGRKPIAT